MPTCSIQGILDGTITSFPQFAKECMMEYGATSTIRYNGIDAKITPSDYYATEIEEAKQLLKDAEALSDEVIVQNRKAELENSKEYYLKAIAKEKVDTKNMNDILKDVRKWQPPTSEHTGIKYFMIDQIEKTLDFVSDTEYIVKKIAIIERELSTLNAYKVRKDMVAKAKNDLDSITEEYNEEVEKCDRLNKWVSGFIGSLTA